MSTSPLSFDPLVIQNLPGDSFLDVGCGYGKWGYLLKKYRWSSDRTTTVTGIDLFEPHLRSLQKHDTYDSLLVGSATNMPFKDRSFDSAIACEVLEHLPQSGGSKLISELRRVSRLSFVVTTPNFPCLRGGGETLDGFNKYEAHQHNFLFDEFRELGFTQIAGVGLRTPSFRVSRALSSLGFHLPRYSRYLVGFWFADGRKRVLEVE
jgi:SAM-dependent methyltransferase